MPAEAAGVVEGIGERSGLLVLSHGVVAHAECAPDLAAKGVAVGSASQLGQGDDVTGTVEARIDALTDLHDAFTADVALVRVPAGTVVERPLVVVSHVDRDGSASFPHLVVDAGEQSELTVVWYATSADVDAYVNPVIEVRAAPAANVRLVLVQDQGARIWQTGQLHTRTERDATVLVWLAALGGDYARLWVDAALSGQGGSTVIRGIYFGDGTQVHDFRSVQLHDAPRASSDFVLKGAVVDQARGVYTGLIRVVEGARGTDSFLTNRNLVLSDGARVDSVPNLEIENENDLKSCGHAAATGPADEEHRFYLESRGVPSDVAERLIVFGFFDDVVAEVPVPAIRDLLRAAVSRKLERVGALDHAAEEGGR